MPLIIVVDDDPFLLMETTDILTDAGFDTLEAHDADSALAVMRERWQDVAVLVTDVQMPGHLDGLELAAEVHRCWPAIGIVIVSGVSAVGRGKLPGSSQFLPKPYSAASLLDSVRHVQSSRPT